MSALAGAVKAGAISFRALCRDRGRWIVFVTWCPSSRQADATSGSHIRGLAQED